MVSLFLMIIIITLFLTLCSLVNSNKPMNTDGFESEVFIREQSEPKSDSSKAVKKRRRTRRLKLMMKALFRQREEAVGWGSEEGEWKKCPPSLTLPLVVSHVSNRGRNFILQVADLMIQRVINVLIILMLNMALSNYTDLLSVKVWTQALSSN